MNDLDLLQNTRHIAMATVNEDGSPHNTPLFFIYNDDFTKIYWGSHPESLHSINAERTKRAFVVVFNSKVLDKGGLYIRLHNAASVSDVDLPEAMRIHNNARIRWDKQPLDIEYYQKEGGQSMYCAEIETIEAYSAVRGTDGLISRETRKLITPKDLGF
jgi:hypothetical protein